MSPKFDSIQKFDTSADLRRHWSQERAYRTGIALTRSVLVLALFAVLLNASFAGALEVTADLVLIVGCLLSLYLTKRRLPKREFVWWPYYATFLIATAPSAWLSGGLYSPWLGLYLAVAVLMVTVMQNRFPPIYNLCFVVLNLLAWLAIGYLHPYPQADAYLHQLPPAFLFSAAAIMLYGIGYCVHALLRTERDLAHEIQRQYAELFATRATLLREENANQAKSAFLANISHELRTPLGAILGYANLLHDARLTVADRELFTQTIERNAEQLAHLVDDLLDLAKIEAGHMEIELLDCRVIDLVREVVTLLNVNAKTKGLELNVNFTGPVPETVRTDPFRLKQILMNIVGNALKFTERGSVQITLGWHGDDELTISVRDTGRGISALEREKLFKPFSQADASMTRRYGGTGLGLNFSRELAELLGGSLELSWSEIGVGSEFILRLHAAKVAGAAWVSHFSGTAALPPPTAQTPLDLRKLRVLLVDDSPDNRDIIRRYLQPTGARVTEAEDGIEALAKIAGGDFDLVLLDIQMPRLDGLQTVARLRALGFTRPVIAVTAHAMKHDRDECLRAGFNDHLTKPLQSAGLLAAIQRYGLGAGELKAPAHKLPDRPPIEV